MMVVVPQNLTGSTVLEKPRVISEIRKNKKSRERSQDSQPRISGELEWGVEGSPWQPRHVEVRDGCLVVLTSPRGQPELRIPLRSLNLQPANRPRAFTLSRDQALPVATFQASSEEEYERWVKTLAVELMRQTPLEAVRFLDILGITASIENNRQMRRGVSEDNLMMIDHAEREGRHRSRKPKLFEGRNNHFSTPHSIIEAKINKDNVVRDRFRGVETTNLKRDFLENMAEDEGIVADELKPRTRTSPILRSSGSVESVFDGRRVYGRHPKHSLPIFESDSDAEEGERDVAQLILKCQQVDSYVPVKEKRRLFESLCKARRLAQSSENLSLGGGGGLKKTKRARSLHDLSRCNVAVSEICRYFEQRGKGDRSKDDDRSSGKEECTNAYLSRRRLQRKERRLERIKLQTADAEEEIWRVQEDMAALDRVRHAQSQEGSPADRATELKLYAGLEHRLAEEEDRLSRLQDEAARALREVELATIRFEASLMKAGEDTGRQ